MEIITDQGILNKFIKFLTDDSEYELDEATVHIAEAIVTKQEEVLTVYTIKYKNGVEDKLIFGKHDIIHINPYED